MDEKFNLIRYLKLHLKNKMMRIKIKKSEIQIGKWFPIFK